jgi:uncharacterized protein
VGSIAENTARRQVPYVDYLVLGGDPHLVARQCASCGAIFLDRRNACARCGRAGFRARRLETTGRLRAFTIVHRTVPGVEVPYVAGIVDLDGGGVVKAHITDVPPDASRIPLGGRVELITRSTGPDSTGTEAIVYAFRPVAGSERVSSAGRPS